MLRGKTVRAEERLALACKQPSAFIYGRVAESFVTLSLQQGEAFWTVLRLLLLIGTPRARGQFFLQSKRRLYERV